MRDDGSGGLLLRHEDLVPRGRAQGWANDAYTIFHRKLISPDFPCYLATAALRHGDLRYCFIERDDLFGLAPTLRAFSALAQHHPERRHLLAAFFQPDPVERAHAYYREKFWEVLGDLARNDVTPWPAEMPTSPDDPRWTFCFARTPYFVFLNAPSYKRRTSRNLGPGMIIMFQPRLVFDGLEGNTRAGIKAREAIRRRLERHDDAPPHSHLGYYGDPTNREWKQFALPDDQTEVTGRCPLDISPSLEPSGPSTDRCPLSAPPHQEV